MGTCGDIICRSDVPTRKALILLAFLMVWGHGTSKIILYTFFLKPIHYTLSKPRFFSTFLPFFIPWEILRK